MQLWEQELFILLVILSLLITRWYHLGSKNCLPFWLTQVHPNNDGSTCGARTAYPPVVPELFQGLGVWLCWSILIFCVLFWVIFLVFLPFFFYAMLLNIRLFDVWPSFWYIRLPQHARLTVYFWLPYYQTRSLLSFFCMVNNLSLWHFIKVFIEIIHIMDSLFI